MDDSSSVKPPLICNTTQYTTYARQPVSIGHRSEVNKVLARRDIKSQRETKRNGNDFIKAGRTFALLHGSLNWHSNSRTMARANDFKLKKNYSS